MSDKKPAEHEQVQPIAGQSQDILARCLEDLRRCFPGAFSEGKVDFERLREALGDVVDNGPERYTFTWAGRGDALRLLQMPSRATLLPCPEESVDWDSTHNVFIEGDNFETLKLLLRPYYERVKMIYIDPPYNTGKDFVYRDDYRDSLGAYLQMSGQSDEAGNLLTSNLDTNGRYHSAWLSMMYPRLWLAKQLLRADGVIFISIDDHEVHNLRMIMNEIFGEENFVAEMVWEGALKNDSRFVSMSHDYILCYARSIADLSGNNTKWRTQKEGIDAIYAKVEKLRADAGEDYARISEDLKKWYTSLNKNNPAWAHRHYNRVDARGIYFPGDISWPGGGGPDYPIPHPVTGKNVTVPARGWSISSPEKLLELVADDRVEFGPDESKVPAFKRYLHETEGQVLPSIIYRDRRGAMQRLRRLMGKDVFENPKDEQILAKLIEAAADHDAIILDFFAGSCTTAQAVLELNREDGGNRRFMMVQLPEPVVPSEESGKKALEMGLSTIAEIGKERIRRVIARLHEEQSSGASAEDLGFRTYKLTSSNYRSWSGVEAAGDDDELPTPATYIAQMEMFTDSLVESWTPEAVIAEVALKEAGFGLNYQVESIDVPEQSFYRISDPDREQVFYLCLAERVCLEALKPLELDRDTLFVCRASALDDQSAANLALQCRLRVI